MFELLRLLYERFQIDAGIPSTEAIAEYLAEEGYAPHDVSRIINCLESLFHPNITQTKQPAKGTIRIFNTHEQNLLPQEVRGLLHLLSQNENISFQDYESVISTLMLLPRDEITLDVTKFLVFLRLILSHNTNFSPKLGDRLFHILQLPEYNLIRH